MSPPVSPLGTGEYATLVNHECHNRLSRFSMKRVYSHPNSMMVGSMAGLLEQSGIESEMRNDILGGASGEIAPGETWVELWVKDASQADRAIQIIQESMQQAEGEDWQCTRCDESNPASFDTCWKCGALGAS